MAFCPCAFVDSKIRELLGVVEELDATILEGRAVFYIRKLYPVESIASWLLQDRISIVELKYIDWVLDWALEWVYLVKVDIAVGT